MPRLRPSRRVLLRVVTGALFSGALVGCGERENPLDRSPDAIAPLVRDETAPAVDGGTALSLERIGNATFTLSSIAGERVTLRGGSYDRERPVRVVTLADGMIEVADFDSDGAPEAAVIVSVIEGTPPPGQPPVPITHLVMLSGSPPMQEGELQLPYRSRVAAIRNRRGILEIDLVTFAPGDRACCPTGRETRRYRYAAGRFESM